MNTWDHLAEQAHRLLTRPRRADLTPAVTLIRSLHKQAPESPASICAHLETATSVLPQLARYAHSGDRHALLMAAVLMRHPLRRIAEMADPDGYRSSDRDARDNDTLRIFFEIISTAGEPQTTQPGRDHGSHSLDRRGGEPPASLGLPCPDV